MTVRAKTDRGNDAFREKRYKTARACYTQALEKGGKDTVLGDTVAARVAAAVQTGDVGRSAALNRAACRYVREDACADREEQNRANARVSLFTAWSLDFIAIASMIVRWCWVWSLPTQKPWCDAVQFCISVVSCDVIIFVPPQSCQPRSLKLRGVPIRVAVSTWKGSV